MSMGEKATGCCAHGANCTGEGTHDRLVEWDHRIWRVGRKVGRTIYAQVGPESSDDDVLIGVMDTFEYAVDACTHHNNFVMTHEAAARVTMPSDWDTCPFCPERLPEWAARAKWEHVDQAHRDDGPADTPWRRGGESEGTEFDGR